MKDRTLIILALVFLVFTIGSGVNKSLEEGNKMMGKDMAPDLGRAVQVVQPGTLIERVKGYIVSVTGNSGKEMNERYVQLAAKAEKINLNEKKENGVIFIREKISELHAKASHLLATAKEKVLAKKNEQAQ